MDPVAAHNLKVGVTGHHKAMPVEKFGGVQRLTKALKKVDHQGGDARLSRTDTLMISLQAKMATNRRLDAVTIQDFAFNSRTIQCRTAH
jgi:hypothetical protein